MSELKRVSFEVAKAVKEAEYPQDIAKAEYLFDINGCPSTGFEQCEEFVCPTYLEVWLWLWREKKKILEPVHCKEGWCVAVIGINGFYPDPEEAIIAAIEYLAENNLIK